jgi:hypothetical protein
LPLLVGFTPDAAAYERILSGAFHSRKINISAIFAVHPTMRRQMPHRIAKGRR